MNFSIYIQNGGTESLLYDSEAGSTERAIVSPHLKLELNKAGSLEFSIMPSHPLYDSFSRMKTYVRIMADGTEIFRGRVLSVEDTTWLERKIQCEGDLAYLIDSIQYPDQTETSTKQADLSTNNTAARNRVVNSQKENMPSESITVSRVDLSATASTHESIQNHFIRYLTVHNSQVDSSRQFGVGSITIDNSAVEQDFTSTHYRDTKSAMEEDLLKYYGGFLRTRKSGSTVYMDWLKEPGSAASQQIVLGMNLIDLQQQASNADIFTRLIPVGDNQLTIESVNSDLNYIQNNSGVSKYGAIYRTETFSGVTDATELKRQAQAWMDANYKDEPLSMTIKAIDMHLLDGSTSMITLGSRVTVVSEPHGITQSLYVTSIEYDIQNPENNSYEIGDPYESLSQKTKNKKQSTEKAASAASTKASRASGSASSLQDAVNRHAANIIDIADKTYSLQADELNITARVITVEADLLEIHTKALTITANRVTLTADYAVIGNIIMGGGGDYELYLIGDTMLYGNLSVGSDIGADSIYGTKVYYDDEDLGTAPVTFLTPTVDASGKVTFPFWQANGLKNTDLTFNQASTTFYKNGVEAAWNNGGKTAHVTGISRTLNVPSGETPTNLALFDSYYRASAGYLDYNGSSQSADRYFYVKTPAISLQNKTGSNKITSNGTYTASSGYNGLGTVEVDVSSSSADVSSSDIRITNVYHGSTGYGNSANTISSLMSTNSSGYVMFTVKINGTDAEKQYHIACS